MNDCENLYHCKKFGKHLHLYERGEDWQHEKLTSHAD